MVAIITTVLESISVGLRFHLIKRCKVYREKADRSRNENEESSNFCKCSSVAGREFCGMNSSGTKKQWNKLVKNQTEFKSLINHLPVTANKIINLSMLQIPIHKLEHWLLIHETVLKINYSLIDSNVLKAVLSRLLVLCKYLCIFIGSIFNEIYTSKQPNLPLKRKKTDTFLLTD
jgi:hypothetical protein